MQARENRHVAPEAMSIMGGYRHVEERQINKSYRYFGNVEVDASLILTCISARRLLISVRSWTLNTADEMRILRRSPLQVTAKRQLTRASWPRRLPPVGTSRVPSG